MSDKCFVLMPTSEFVINSSAFVSVKEFRHFLYSA